LNSLNFFFFFFKEYLHFSFGGLVEQDEREFTLSDLYSLNLEKLDKFETLIGQPVDTGKALQYSSY